MNLSVRTKLTFSFALVFTALIILFSGVVYYFMASNLEKELHTDTSHFIEQVISEFETLPWDKAVKEMQEESDEFELKIQVLAPNRQIIFLTEGVKPWDWHINENTLEKASHSPIWTTEDINGVSHIVLTQSFTAKNRPPHFLRIGKSRSDINKIKNHLIYCINIGTPLILFLALLVGRFLSKKALEPVDRTFIQMKRFIADASHELRIPLTGLRGTVEVALRQPRSNEEYKQTLETVYSESERLSELVWDLLSLARADAGELKIEKTDVDIEEFIKNVFDEAEALNAEKKVQLRLGKVPRGKAKFDETKVHQLLVNLLENAIRYNKPGGDVQLLAELKPGTLVLSVKDTGIGISEEDQAKIFDRFYRVDKARSREAGGTGLGLSIARSIAEAHQGTLAVRSVFGQGSEFSLTLPLS